MRKDLHEANRLSWNAATVAHNSYKGDQAAFSRNGGPTLFPEELELLGAVAGLNVLHLQYNAGQDGLSLARLGADVHCAAIVLGGGAASLLPRGSRRSRCAPGCASLLAVGPLYISAHPRAPRPLASQTRAGLRARAPPATGGVRLPPDPRYCVAVSLPRRGGEEVFAPRKGQYTGTREKGLGEGQPGEPMHPRTAPRARVSAPCRLAACTGVSRHIAAGFRRDGLSHSVWGIHGLPHSGSRIAFPIRLDRQRPPHGCIRVVSDRSHAHAALPAARDRSGPGTRD